MLHVSVQLSSLVQYDVPARDRQTDRQTDHGSYEWNNTLGLMQIDQLYLGSLTTDNNTLRYKRNEDAI